MAASSPFFDKALNGEYKEHNGKVELPTFKPADFSKYVQWLYDRRIHVQPVDGNWVEYMDLVVLGNYIRDQHFVNATTDSLIDRTSKKKCCPIGLAPSAWNELPASHPFINLLIDFWVYNRQIHWFDDESDDISEALPNSGSKLPKFS